MVKARDICLIAILSATLTAGKMALSFIANVEVVTLLLTVYALTLPRSRVLIATFVFIATDILIWGAHIWIIMYLIHWPTLVLCVSFLKGKYAPIFAIIIAVLLTGLFGVQTTIIEVLLLSNFQNIGFIKSFLLRYGTGIPYFITHVVSNAIILPVLVYPLYRLMKSLARQYFKTPAKNDLQNGADTMKAISSSQEQTQPPAEQTQPTVLPKPAPTLTDAPARDTIDTSDSPSNQGEEQQE